MGKHAWNAIFRAPFFSFFFCALQLVKFKSGEVKMKLISALSNYVRKLIAQCFSSVFSFAHANERLSWGGESINWMQNARAFN